MHPDETMVENGIVTPVSDANNETEAGMEATETEAAEISSASPEDAGPTSPVSDAAGGVTPVVPPAEKPSFLATEYAALAAEMPEGLPFATLAAFPALGAFLLLREKGVGPREAYLALAGTGATPATPVADLSHLRAAAPQTVAPQAPALLSQETLREWRRLFPHLSDKQIGALYRRTAPTEQL